MKCFICEDELDGHCIVNKKIHDGPIHDECMYLVESAMERTRVLSLIPLCYPAWFIARIMQLNIYDNELGDLSYDWVAYSDSNGSSSEGSFWGCHTKEEMEKYILSCQENDGSGWYLSYVFHKGKQVNFSLQQTVKWGQYV